MILDFHLSPYRDGDPLPFLLFTVARFNMVPPQSMCVSDRYPAYREAFKRLLPEKIHLRVEDFADDILTTS